MGSMAARLPMRQRPVNSWRETGIKISPQKLSLGHVRHNKTHGDEWMGLYFVADDPGQEPRLAEPEKHGAVRWQSDSDHPERHDPIRSTSARFNPAGRGLLHLLRLELARTAVSCLQRGPVGGVLERFLVFGLRLLRESLSHHHIPQAFSGSAQRGPR